MEMSYSTMNIEYHINNNDIITHINTDFIQFGRENSQDKFIPETWLGVKLFQAICGDDTRMFHGLMLQKVRIQQKSITYRYRCDAPHLARFMIMNIIPEKNIVRYENIIEDEVSIPNKIIFKSNEQSNVKRCSLCNHYSLGNIWIDPAMEPKNRSRLMSWHVRYCVCMKCRSKIGK